MSSDQRKDPAAEAKRVQEAVKDFVVLLNKSLNKSKHAMETPHDEKSNTPISPRT